MSRLLRPYILLLTVALVGILLVEIPNLDADGETYALLGILGLLFFASEFADVYFYDETGGRWGLSFSAAFLIPMLVVLPLPLVTVGVATAILAERAIRRLGLAKIVFNTASCGVAAAAAAFLWEQLADPMQSLSLRDAAVASAAAITYALLTHLFASLAIALAERGDFLAISRAVASTTVISNAGAILVGIFFASSLLAAHWIVLLFPPAFFALYLGNRAIVRQRQERERVEHLHAASRMLAAAPDLNEAVTGFLREIQKIASTKDACAFFLLPQGPSSWRVQGETISAQMEEASDDETLLTFQVLTQVPGATILREDEPEKNVEIRRALGAKTALVIPLLEGETRVGAIAVMNRLGAGEFEESDARLLEALGNELLVSLGSFRLFAEITEERERFARIFNGSKEGICLIDADGVVGAWNPALERITGYPAADVMGVRWSDRVMVRDADRKRVEGPELVSLSSDDVVEVVTRDGPTRWVSVVSGPVQSEGEAGGWVVLMRDMTAEHDVEQAKSDFLSTISHELRTPLTTIKGALQVLERGTDNLPKDLTEQMIGVTTRGAERLERLVMNLLIVSQIESGAMPVFIEEISMPDVVRERVGTFLRDHAEVELEVGAKEIHVRADRERLPQVIEHLLENALKFGGAQGKISVSLDRSNGYAHLSVTDEGPGIAPGDHERIFERFIRLGNVLTRETQGAGVGLFIAKSAVDAMGGEIWVESEPGPGSTFHVQIPLARPVTVEQAEGA